MISTTMTRLSLGLAARLLNARWIRSPRIPARFQRLGFWHRTRSRSRGHTYNLARPVAPGDCRRALPASTLSAAVGSVTVPGCRWRPWLPAAGRRLGLLRVAGPSRSASRKRRHSVPPLTSAVVILAGPRPTGEFGVPPNCCQQRHPGVLKKHRQPMPQVQHILDGLAEGALGQCLLSPGPRLDLIDHRRRSLAPHGQNARQRRLPFRARERVWVRQVAFDLMQPAIRSMTSAARRCERLKPRLRDKGQSLSAISAADISKLDSRVDDQLANALVCKFNYQ